MLCIQEIYYNIMNIAWSGLVRYCNIYSIKQFTWYNILISSQNPSHASDWAVTYFSITRADLDLSLVLTGNYNIVLSESVKTFFGKTYLRDYCNTAKQLLSGLAVFNQHGEYYTYKFRDDLESIHCLPPILGIIKCLQLPLEQKKINAKPGLS